MSHNASIETEKGERKERMKLMVKELTMKLDDSERERQKDTVLSRLG